jgi:acyl-phosphate glycerol 3-phosphate acyltransferase
MFHLYYILIPLICYLAGSLPTAYFFVKNFSGQDIRKIGSGNVGAMNTLRALKEKSGKLAAIGFVSVVTVDMLKGVFSVFLVQSLRCLDYDLNIFLALAGFFVVLGHNYSVFLKFTGGRGAACLIGIMLFMDPASFFVWGAPLVICSVIAQIILEKKNLIEKINWKKPSDFLIMIGGKQMAGRMFGLILGPVFLYFYNVQIFLPIAAGTTLLLIKNVSRFKEYFKGFKK